MGQLAVLSGLFITCLVLQRVVVTVTAQRTHLYSVTTSGQLANGDKLDPLCMDLGQWESLPGIGPKLAARIVTYRDKHGAFVNKKGLRRVRGIGPALVKKVTPFIEFRTNMDKTPACVINSSP